MMISSIDAVAGAPMKSSGRVVVYHPDDALWTKIVEASGAELATAQRCQGHHEAVASISEPGPCCAVLAAESLTSSPDVWAPIAQIPCLAPIILAGASTDDPLLGTPPPAFLNLSAMPEQGELRSVIRSALATAQEREEDRRLVHEFYQRLEQLTPEERGVFDAVCKGKLNKQMAREFNVSIRTVEQRRRRVFTKMDSPSAAPLAASWATVRTLARLLPGLKPAACSMS